MKRASTRLKALETKKTQIQQEIAAIQESIRTLDQGLKGKQNQLNQVSNEIQKLSDTGDQGLPIITEHALLRYLERVEGVNIDEARANIYSDKFRRVWTEMGVQNGEFPFRDGVGRLVIKNNKIVTIK